MKKTALLIIVFSALLIGLINEGIIDQDKVSSLITSLAVEEVKEPQIMQETAPDIRIAFCPSDDCESMMLGSLETAQKSIHCAFFDLDLPDVIEKLIERSKEMDVKLVLDNDNWKQLEEYKLDFAIKDTSSQLSHNKFCIIDNATIITGSTNPTVNGVTKNNNNLLIIESRHLAKNHEDEFQELWNKEFGKGATTQDPEVMLNNKTRIRSYFCPEDWCANKIIFELEKADSTIHFMTFSFTHDGIGDKIIEKHDQGVEVKGLFEKQQVASNKEYSEYQRMLDAGITDIKTDSNPANMHHKVFIIDEKTVITGSMNPTKNGDEENDENILIIDDPNIAKLFLNEFYRLYNAGI